jgi:hypothetical protein
VGLKCEIRLFIIVSASVVQAGLGGLKINLLENQVVRKKVKINLEN